MRADQDERKRRLNENAVDFWMPSGEQRKAMAAQAGPANGSTGGQPTNEVTGIPSLVSYLAGVASTHSQIGSGEAFLGSLIRMDVGADDRQLVADAQEASANAAGMWKTASDEIARHNLPLHEQYALNPSAGNKDANTNE